jgi:transposase
MPPRAPDTVSRWGGSAAYDQSAATERPAGVRLLYERLVAEHGFTGTYKAVLRYVRRRMPVPSIRPFRRVEMRLGMQTQVDWYRAGPGN